MVDAIPFLEGVFGDYAVAMTQVIYFIVSFLVIYLVGKVVINQVIERLLKSKGLDEHTRKPIEKILGWAVIFGAFALAFGFAGYGNFLLALTTVAAAATLAIGFAMQDIIKNFFSGIFIYVEKPFKIGDWIQWDGNSGVVEDISLRVSRVRSFDNELMTVPNSLLTDDVVTNPVAKDKLRLKFIFGIGYEDDIKKATKIINEEANKHPEILDNPEPSVRLTELADSYVGLQSRFWIAHPDRSDFIKVKSEYVENVKQRFDEEDIEIPYPQVDLSGKIQTQ
ncbi:MAG: Small-conductance mechanosensitive channel, MscC family [Candidatus Methanohalarchaeum thermophilum]|uniref:Small-conductance mechanosensitive channel, MscC family n=1 Tax=Methanohalarchaeum thermophilum TaxID=1903181 RepID=A0A1Q6DWF8_METT1|nr:MAG: Small-conductance mechanosensitive channel, MscC family [Candidatus Methanohalarchaeum thermophilum]